MDHKLNAIGRRQDVEVLQSRAGLLPKHDGLAGISLKLFHNVCNALVAETGTLDPVAEQRNPIAGQKAPRPGVVLDIVERNEALQKYGGARLRNSKRSGYLRHGGGGLRAPKILQQGKRPHRGFNRSSVRFARLWHVDPRFVSSNHKCDVRLSGMSMGMKLISTF